MFKEDIHHLKKIKDNAENSLSAESTSAEIFDKALKEVDTILESYTDKDIDEDQFFELLDELHHVLDSFDSNEEYGEVELSVGQWHKVIQIFQKAFEGRYTSQVLDFKLAYLCRGNKGVENLFDAASKIIKAGDIVPPELDGFWSAIGQRGASVDNKKWLEFITVLDSAPGQASGIALHSVRMAKMMFEEDFVFVLKDLIENGDLTVPQEYAAIDMVATKVGQRKGSVEAEKFLEEHIQNRKGNLLLKEKVRTKLQPLEYFTLADRRALLRVNWIGLMRDSGFVSDVSEVLGSENLVENPDVLEGLNDQKIQELFSLYRESNIEFFRWAEIGDLRQHYEKRYLRDSYNLDPLACEVNGNGPKIKQDAVYSHLNDRYGVINIGRGRVDSFFLLDSKIEDRKKELIQRFGDLTSEQYDYFISQLDFGIELDDVDLQELYFLARGKLPTHIVEKCDALLKVSEMPDSLSQKFESRGDFEKAFMEIKDAGVEFYDNNKEAWEEILGILKQARDELGDENAKDQLGYRFGDVNLIDHFDSFMMRNPSRTDRKHFSFAYYLNMRRGLPTQLVDEFEQEFDLDIPEKLKNLQSFQEYLDTPEFEVLAPFEGNPRSFEMKTWLRERLQTLKHDIHEHTKELYGFESRQLTIHEILEIEGFSRGDMSEDEYDKLVATYHTLLELPVRRAIERLYGFPLSSMTVREQIQFVNFLSDINDTWYLEYFITGKGSWAGADGKGVSEESRINRAKSFFALEGDVDNAKYIYAIGNGFKREVSDVIFSKYADLVHEVQGVKDRLGQMIGIDQGDINREDVDGVTRELMKGVNGLLVEIGKGLLAQEIDDTELSTHELYQYVVHKISEYKENLILMKAVLKGLKGKVSIEDLQGISFDSYSLQGFRELQEFEKLKQRMIDIYEKNYVDMPNLKAKIVDGFAEMLDSGQQDTSLHILHDEKDVIAFCRFDKMEQAAVSDRGQKYFGSFNVNPGVQNVRVGTVFLEETLEKYAEDNDIIADCVPGSPISPWYIKSAGFIVTGVEEAYSEDGDLLHIERRPQNNEYMYRQAEVDYEYLRNNAQVFTDELVGQENFVVKFDIGDSALDKLRIQLLNNDDYVETYFFEDRSRGISYSAFEKKK